MIRTEHGDNVVLDVEFEHLPDPALLHLEEQLPRTPECQPEHLQHHIYMKTYHRIQEPTVLYHIIVPTYDQSPDQSFDR